MTTNPTVNFGEWEAQWKKEKEEGPQSPMELEEVSTAKREVHDSIAPTFMCGHCGEVGRGIPFELPDPTGEVGPQGTFCDKRCGKSVALYEIQREDVADLIDKMAGMTVEPAAPWSKLESVIGEGGVTRDDWSDSMPLDEEDRPLDEVIELPQVVDGTGVIKKIKNEISD